MTYPQQCMAAMTNRGNESEKSAGGAIVALAQLLEAGKADEIRIVGRREGLGSH